MSFLKKMFSFIGRLFTGPNAQRLAEMILHYAELALPIVSQIAALTPTRIDDEIIALFTRYGLPNLDAYLALPIADRGPALLAAATSELSKLVPAGTSRSILQAAIQLALVNMKASDGPQI